GATGTTTHQQSPVHRGQLLRLVDDHVPEGPVTVGHGTLCGTESTAVLLPFGQQLRVQHVRHAEHFLVDDLLVLFHHMQDAFGVGTFLTFPACLFGPFLRVVHPEQFSQLV